MITEIYYSISMFANPKKLENSFLAFTEILCEMKLK